VGKSNKKQAFRKQYLFCIRQNNTGQVLENNTDCQAGIDPWERYEYVVSS